MRHKNSKHVTMNEKVKGDRIFYWFMLAIPIIHFIIFYIYVNLDSFVLAFQKYDIKTNTYNFTEPWHNFNKFFAELTESSLLTRGLLYNFLNYLVSIFIWTPLTIALSFFLYKKIPGHKAFRILLYAPTIISSTVWVLVFSQTVENLIPAIAQVFGADMSGLLSNPDTQFVTLLYFQKWYSIGGGTLLYVATMAGVPEEQVDAMKIDGAGTIVEFFNLTMPSIWPIISLFLWSGVSKLIVDDLNLYTFYGEQAPTKIRTFGYWLKIIKFRAASNVFDLPYVAAIGMLQSALILPIMFGFKKLLSKLGPSEV